MKKSSSYLVNMILFLVLFSSSLQAQNPEIDREFTSFEEVKDYMNNIFSRLEKQRIPYGILLDKAVSISDITYFNGVYPKEERDTLDINTLFQVGSTLATAKITDNSAVVMPPEDMESVFDSFVSEESLVLGGVFYKYARLKPDLKEGQLIMENDVLYDSYINGVWQNPYEVQQSFVIAPIRSYHSGKEIEVLFPSNLWFSNMNDSIQSIEIDFDDGKGFKPVILDSSMHISYPATGRYEWMTRLTLANGNVLFSPTFLKVLPDLNADTGCTENGRDLGFTGVRPYQGKTNKAFIEIAYGYGNPNCEMRRPLIVVEGYDPGLDKRKDGLGTNRFVDFAKDLNLAGQELGSALFYYDVVYVNWLNATDDMRRNAYLLEDIIKWVNAQKVLAGSSEPNVVLGQSMGGVIARYALRDMENRGENHDTRLYISHDAPHQGANIPRGIRELANDVGFNIPSLYFTLAGMRAERKAAKKMMQAPATKQLVEEISGSSNLFQEWQTELKNMGYPQQTRNIAISNGSGCGQKQDIDFKERIVDGFIPLKSKVQIFGTGLGKIKHGGINLEVYASPDVGQSSLGYYIRIYNRVKIYGMTKTNVVYKKSLNFTSYKIPLDTYAGGVYDFNLGVNGVEYKPFNFIPVTSAFDVGKGNVTLTEADYLKSYSVFNNPSTPKQIPFDNFIAPRTGTSVRNTRHISFNTQIGDWLAKEINNEQNIQDCNFICAQEEQVIEGSNLICQSAIYQTNLTADSYQWQVVRGGDLVTMQVINNRKITLNRINTNDNGLVVLELQMGSSECGEAIFRKEIWVGKPNIRVEVHNEGSYMEATVLPWSSNDADLDTQQASVVWESNPPIAPGVNTGFFDALGFTARTYGVGKYWGLDVKVTVSNACGSVTRNFGMYSGFMHADDEGANVILGIVPAKDPNEYEVIASIQTREGGMEDVPLAATDKVAIYVHNMAGQLIQTVKEPRVNINHLQSGAYILNAIVNDTYRAELKVYKR